MIRLRVEGLMLERLLERALEGGAVFSRVVRDGPRAMIFETGERGARVLNALCERHSLRLEIQRVTGLNALKRFFLRRWTLLPGLALCAALYVAAYFLRTPVYMLMDGLDVQGLLGRALARAFDVARYALLAGTLIYGSVALRRRKQNGAEENG